MVKKDSEETHQIFGGRDQCLTMKVFYIVNNVIPDSVVCVCVCARVGGAHGL